MIVRTFLAAVATVAIPVALVGAAEPTQRKSDSSEKKICEIDTTLGTRLGNTRRCRTKAERDAHKQEAREVVDRIQSYKPVTCPPSC